MKPLHGPVDSVAAERGEDLVPDCIAGLRQAGGEALAHALDGAQLYGVSGPTGPTRVEECGEQLPSSAGWTASTWLPSDPIPAEFRIPLAVINPTLVFDITGVQLHGELPAPIGSFLNPADDIIDMTTLLTSHEYTHHDAPGQPGWKEARPVPSDKTHRLDIRINDRIVYSQDVDEYQLEHTQDAVLLSATRNGALSKVELSANPLLPTGTPLTVADAPADSAPAPDADVDDPKASDADSAEPPVVETVHTGERDVAADEAQRKADRAARRKAAAEAEAANAEAVAQPDGAAE